MVWNIMALENIHTVTAKILTGAAGCDGTKRARTTTPTPTPTPNPQTQPQPRFVNKIKVPILKIRSVLIGKENTHFPVL